MCAQIFKCESSFCPLSGLRGGGGLQKGFNDLLFDFCHKKFFGFVILLPKASKIFENFFELRFLSWCFVREVGRPQVAAISSFRGVPVPSYYWLSTISVVPSCRTWFLVGDADSLARRAAVLH
jgi:hypothetical protein